MVKEEEELIVADKTDIDFNDKLYNSVVEPEHSSSSSEGHVDNNETSRKKEMRVKDFNVSGKICSTLCNYRREVLSKAGVFRECSESPIGAIELFDRL